MYIEVNTRKQLAAFLARATTFVGLGVVASKGVDLVFPGVTHLRSLEVETEPGGSVSFPDLILVADDCDIRLAGNSRVNLPVLREVGDYIDVNRNPGGYTDYYRPEEEFDALTRQKVEFGAMPELNMPDTVLEMEGKQYHWRDAQFDVWMPIANDMHYVLYFNPKKRAVKAGCRAFSNISQALTHWKSVAEHYKVYGRCEREERALMFVLALMNLQDQLKKG